MSLRTRLLLVLAVLAVGALLAADIATYAALKSFLTERVDRTVTASSSVLAQALAEQEGIDSTDLQQLAKSTPGVYIGLIREDGTVVWNPIGIKQGETPPPPPKLPDRFDRSAFTTPFTIDSEVGSSQFRASLAHLNNQSTLIVAAPLNDVADTLHRVVVIEIIVSLIAIGAIVGLGLWLVRMSLMPLRKIEETAGAIARGDLTQRISPVDDKTEVGRLAIALNAMLAQIEHAFEQRTESERRLRRFIGDASHELRTPLSSVQAYAELFRRGARDNPQDLARVMRGIEREAIRMGLLIDDLLLLARLDQGRPLEKKNVELTAIVEESVEISRTLDPSRQIEIKALSPVTITGDPERLRQVVDNLLANVRSHTPENSGATVMIGSKNGLAYIEVADQGPGLSQDAGAHVFDRFYRADRARSRDKGGAGLGLAIVAAIVGAHGGRVDVSNPPEGGAKFRIELPMQAAEPQPEPSQDAKLD